MTPTPEADTRSVATRSHAQWVRRSGEPQRVSWVDHEVVTSARAGDPNSLGDLHTAATPRLIAFFRYSGLTKVESEDLAADVMEKVIRSLAGLRDPRAFEAWIWTIARNTLAGHMRRRRREPTEPATPAGMEPPDIVELAEEHSLIRAALEKLPMRDRQLLWLREVERLTHAEIGGWLGAATGAVRVAVHRARRRLEQAYGEISQENSGGRTDEDNAGPETS